jgi:hypothetical protein
MLSSETVIRGVSILDVIGAHDKIIAEFWPELSHNFFGRTCPVFVWKRSRDPEIIIDPKANGTIWKGGVVARLDYFFGEIVEIEKQTAVSGDRKIREFEAHAITP